MKLYELPALYYGLHPAFQILLILLFAFIGGELIRLLLNTGLQVYKRRTGDAWKLRVMVREKLFDFIRSHYPESLPRTRAEIQEVPASPDTTDSGNSRFFGKYASK